MLGVLVYGSLLTLSLLLGTLVCGSLVVVVAGRTGMQIAADIFVTGRTDMWLAADVLVGRKLLYSAIPLPSNAPTDCSRASWRVLPSRVWPGPKASFLRLPPPQTASLPKPKSITYLPSAPAHLIDNHASIIHRCGAGVVRFMRLIASGHGNGIRGTSRAENQR